jgi:hypothetical protein
MLQPLSLNKKKCETVVHLGCVNSGLGVLQLTSWSLYIAATCTMDGQTFRMMASNGAGIATRLTEAVLHPLSMEESLAKQAFVNVRAIVVKI